MENKYNRDLYTHGLETYEAEYEKNTNGRDFVFGVVLGTVVGGIVGLLLAPKSGKELQDDLSEKSNKIIDDVKTKTDDLKVQAQSKAEEIKTQAEEKKEEVKTKVEDKKAQASEKAEEVKSKQAEKKANKGVVTADDVGDEELKAQKGAIKSEVENEDLKGPKTVVEKKTFDKK
ncbi:YtxH domain-containing protein [Mammaliicoccus sciuri]|uniref:YtxH domain-containing protein n=1 Tax=Mammaliicoccus sciuri TaxID=1296 RepID=UPI001FB1CAA4|nr:YtxH domain-containing protein [Mammaliicoccus sciuri]MCJ0922906.1 YtxH domain-containing protein [Mammaliicoccus sciuri]